MSNVRKLNRYDLDQRAFYALGAYLYSASHRTLENTIDSPIDAIALAPARHRRPSRPSSRGRVIVFIHYIRKMMAQVR